MALFNFDATQVTPANPRGRKRKSEDEKAKQRTVTMDLQTMVVLKKFGKGNLSAGLRRAAAMVSTFDLYDRTDC